MSSQETSNEKLSSNTNNSVIGQIKQQTLRKSASLKPRKSLLKVRSLRPTRAVLGRTATQEDAE
ncbi:hypothetical protein ACRXCV_04790 [Halobacteriovorax sp. GFR7]|uniref:hypothetical protein n=1 Tax=Bacteriovoracales TaxID=2024979 RepID=UPI000386C683|nr:hypothetical protein [Bacteriovorax sp. BAL6_X]EPZ49846.1 hypothetical protein M902_0659 [Bacteriovorax sp. BAL6_X]